MDYLKTLAGLLLILAVSIVLAVWGNGMIEKARNKIMKGKSDGKKAKTKKRKTKKRG